MRTCQQYIRKHKLNEMGINTAQHTNVAGYVCMSDIFSMVHTDNVLACCFYSGNTDTNCMGLSYVRTQIFVKTVHTYIITFIVVMKCYENSKFYSFISTIALYIW